MKQVLIVALQPEQELDAGQVKSRRKVSTSLAAPGLAPTRAAPQLKLEVVPLAERRSVSEQQSPTYVPGERGRSEPCKDRPSQGQRGPTAPTMSQ